MRIVSFNELKNMLSKHKYRQFHIHHTWRPNHSNFNGSNHISMQEGMRNYHVNTNGWSDIGQHISVFPDGKIVTGRDFGRNPASIKGWNSGAFCMEMIGNFDIGHDKLEGKQKETVLKITKYFIDTYGENSIKFHRENSSKSCPGTSLNKAKLISEAKTVYDKVGENVGNQNVKKEQKVSSWAKEDWEWSKKEGYLDGTRPKDSITREEMAIVVRRLVDNLG